MHFTSTSVAVVLVLAHATQTFAAPIPASDEIQELVARSGDKKKDDNWKKAMDAAKAAANAVPKGALKVPVKSNPIGLAQKAVEALQSGGSSSSPRPLPRPALQPPVRAPSPAPVQRSSTFPQRPQGGPPRTPTFPQQPSMAQQAAQQAAQARRDALQRSFREAGRGSGGGGNGQRRKRDLIADLEARTYEIDELD